MKKLIAWFFADLFGVILFLIGLLDWLNIDLLGFKLSFSPWILIIIGLTISSVAVFFIVQAVKAIKKSP